LTNSPNTRKEKRDEPRAPIELKVEYRRLNTFFADYTKNISKGGTFIKTRKPLKIGTAFVFKLFVPSLDEPISLNGKVQWIVNPGEEEPGEHSGMGIKFEYEGVEGQRKKIRVETTVEKLIVDSLGRHLYEKLLKRHSSEPAS
jgi:type IV pilus assembly protein PilZ